MINNYMLYIRRLLLILVCILIQAVNVLAQTSVPQKERRIYLWDVSGSLLSKEKTIDIYNGQPLPTYEAGNGLWNKLKESLVSSIDQLEDDPQNEIIVIPFYDEICEVIQDKSSETGKKNIIDKIKTFEYNGRGGRTDLIKPLQAFESIVKQDCHEYINYMFFYTDGAHETIKNIPEFDCAKVIERINNFNEYATARGNYIYRFYYLVSPIADKLGNIKQEEADWKKFWVIDDINVKIKYIGLDNTAINYNVCDNPSKGIIHDSYKNIYLTNDGKHFTGDISFDVSNNEYYTVDCIKSNNDSAITIKVKIREGVNKEKLPKHSSIKVNVKLNRTEDEHRYYYLLDQYFYIHCIHTPERNVSLSFKNTTEDKSNDNKRFNLGNTSYYPPFMGKSSQLNCLNFSLTANFDKFAVSDKGCLNISFADSEGKPLTYTKFKIVVNKSDTLSTQKCYCPIESGQKQIDFTILPSENTDDYKFKGYLIVSDINNIDRINGEVIYNDEVKILPWEFEHDRKLNPLLKNLLWIIFLLLLLLFAIYLAFKARALFAPHFPAGCKIAFVAQSDTFNTDIDHNFKLGATYVDKCGVLTENGSNTVATHILRDSYIQKVILSGNEGHMPFQTTIGEKWNGQIIHVTADFFNDLISSIELKPIKNNRGKEDVLVVVKYSNGSVLELKHIEMSKLTPQNTETDSIYIENTKIAIIGKRLKYFNNDSEA